MNMSFLNQIQKLLGEKQTGIKINSLYFEDYNSPKKPIRFCEAVVSSLHSPLIIRKDDIACLGAQRSFGFYKLLINRISIAPSFRAGIDYISFTHSSKFGEFYRLKIKFPEF